MSLAISHLSVKEVKTLFINKKQLPTNLILSQLQSDSRHGVQQIYRALLKQIDKNFVERLRLDKLLAYENQLHSNGIQYIAGVDEAGMGPLAGPVVAAAVIFPFGINIQGINDSKRLTAAQRELLALKIQARATSTGIGIADVSEIERFNIYHAGLLAMRRAVAAMEMVPQHIIVDARTIPDITIPQTAFKQGDAHHYSIAAASILAKTHRDQLLLELDKKYPAYGFSRHKGYGTQEHCNAIREHGPCPAHRTSFSVFMRLRDK